MNIMNEEYLTLGSQSPFLPGTNLQFAWAQEKAKWLLSNGISQGECIISHLAPNVKGYVPVGFGRAIKMRAHRVIFFVANPTVDPSLMVLHKCDNRACIKLEHLFAGTAQDNTDDMIAKGRKVDDPEVGIRRRIATAKLIKSLLNKGYTNAQITAEYGISNSTIWNYTRGVYRDTLTVFAGDETTVCI